MTAKEYLEQAPTIDQRINSKLEQLSELKALATRTTHVLRQDVVDQTRDVHSREEIIAKIIDMEREIKAEVDRLMDLKREICQAISQVKNPTYHTLLELKYLSCLKWEEIREETGYSERNIRRLHKKALAAVKIPTNGSAEAEERSNP